MNLGKIFKKNPKLRKNMLGNRSKARRSSANSSVSGGNSSLKSINLESQVNEDKQ